jgi:hypothetical protein
VIAVLRRRHQRTPATFPIVRRIAQFAHVRWNLCGSSRRSATQFGAARRSRREL